MGNAEEEDSQSYRDGVTGREEGKRVGGGQRREERGLGEVGGRGGGGGA